MKRMRQVGRTRGVVRVPVIATVLVGALTVTSAHAQIPYVVANVSLDQQPIVSDPFVLTVLKPRGQRAILDEEARPVRATARTMRVDGEPRFRGATAFAGTHWNWVMLMDATQESDTDSELDERLHHSYGSIYMSPATGTTRAAPGSQYLQAFKDRDGNRIDGGRSYRLRVPPNVPVSSFWSLTLYDTATRSVVQNERNDAVLSSYDTLSANPDGSIDLYLAPNAPAGRESNWIQTVPGKGFYPFFRFYGPTEPLFDGTWELPDIEPTN